MNNIKPIQTKYKGFLFRSRLEARWAVWFDAINIKWEYEHEGYVLPDGTKYLPDFWLPDLKSFVEIKPLLCEQADQLTPEEQKCSGLSTLHPTFMFCGPIRQEEVVVKRFDRGNLERGRRTMMLFGHYAEKSGSDFFYAFEAASSARFEHGQCGATQ